MDIKSTLTWIVALIGGLLGALLTLSSLEKVDGYPLYTMQYYDSYESDRAGFEAFQQVTGTGETTAVPAAVSETWACSLFAAFGGSAQFGRNFDWEYSPALLLFAHPPDGYDSVSMVDIAYLGFGDQSAKQITDLPLIERGSLLDAPYLPFDGMNEVGLAVGMAAVPASAMPADPGKETIDSLAVIREMLDHARTADEALSIFDRYNIEWGGGPPLHYLIADASGHALLVEFYRGEREVLTLDGDWGAATNFLRVQYPDPAGQCWRYDTLAAQLSAAGGEVTADEALALLSRVAQPNTQWSIVYGIQSGDVQVAMHRNYDTVHRFHLPPAD